MAQPEQIVASWAAESEHFNYASNRCAAGQVCGHYTQVVWRDSTEIGCAVARCSSNSPFGGGEWFMAVCNYSPAGNYTGERPY
ncbi:Cysteine-rich secretory protein family protein [Enhygromyxa salina]|uniref:Cysteine-rich secretory protein family protein n=2 Tax=Enhygromyxa salina TaxID=215803 RepID=A0A2S9Y643_9BACT|nr:Cysteine-rich secretory protein family protein [Enhygromyxa salina]